MKVGGVSATSIVVVSATSITAITPAGSAGAKDVTVTTAGGTATKTSAFTYIVPLPTIGSVSPTSGPTTGGTTITIAGTNLTGATSVTVGGIAATNIVVVSSTSVTATTPAGTAGAKSVAVTTAGGTATKTSAFTYIVLLPTISSVTPTSGPTTGGTTITITGTNLTGATSVKIGGASATSVVVISATSITATTPAGTVGAKSVAVTTAGGTATKSGAFTYVVGAVPTITSISPTSGPACGGTVITITGTNLSGASVMVEGNLVPVSSNTATSFKITTSAHALGSISATLTTASGSVIRSNAFTFTLSAPTITSISPSSGPTSGGTIVTITGTNLCGAELFVEGISIPISDNTNTSFSITTPEHAAGAITGTVKTFGGMLMKANAFTYFNGFTGDAHSPSGADANGGGAVATQGSKGSNGSINTDNDVTASNQADETAVPMGVALYLQTVALRADAASDCSIHNALSGAANDAASNGAVHSSASSMDVDISTATLTNSRGATSSTNNVVMSESNATSAHADSVTESVADSITENITVRIAESSADSVTGMPAAIDLDLNGVADICQLRSGDLDLDGAITQRDMSILLNMIGLEPVFGIGDMDGNGVLDAADVGMILNQLP